MRWTIRFTCIMIALLSFLRGFSVAWLDGDWQSCHQKKFAISSMSFLYLPAWRETSRTTARLRWPVSFATFSSPTLEVGWDSQDMLCVVGPCQIATWINNCSESYNPWVTRTTPSSSQFWCIIRCSWHEEWRPQHSWWEWGAWPIPEAEDCG